MNSRLQLYSGDDAYGKLLEYANILRKEGYKASQIYQDEDEYNRVGISFSIEDRGEFLFLTKVNDYEVMIEIEHKYKGDADMLVALYKMIKHMEDK